MITTVSRSAFLTILFDLFAILFIYFVPAISHALSFPVYFFEPMRIMLILSLVHFRKSNAYIIALTLPLFSFLISSHPSIFKVLLITAELMLNVYLFFFLFKKSKNLLFSALFSIVFSKGIYYALKYSFLSFALLSGSLVSTPIYFQAITTVLLSTYIVIFFKDLEKK